MTDIKFIEENQDVSNEREVWLCGGAQIYDMLLEYCTELYLTRVKRECEGDTFFPEFEQQFRREGILSENDEFVIEKWVRNYG